MLFDIQVDSKKRTRCGMNEMLLAVQFNQINSSVGKKSLINVILIE